jgi:hypothetical protein
VALHMGEVRRGVGMVEGCLDTAVCYDRKEKQDYRVLPVDGE